jgi:uncharacterized membrane protein YgcG
MAWTRRLLVSLASTAAVLVLALLSAMPATASTARSGDTSDFEFASFDAVYTLSRGPDRHAMLDVVETAVAVFPSIDQNRGIIRSIPDYYGDVYLETEVLGVTDENGAPVYYEVQNDGGFTILVIDDDAFKHGATTYVIHYTQRDTIRAFGSCDEFYWDVNGTGWDQPFGEVSAQVVVDAGLAAELTEGESCYQGALNSATPCDSGISRSADADGAIRLSASAQDLGPGENLTVVAVFAAGTFVEGDPVEGGAPYEPEPSLDLAPPPAWSIALSVLGGAASFVTAIVGAVVLRGRRARPTGFIVPQYSVPDGLDVMVAAELIERRSTAVQAQLVSLAVKRRIRLLGYPVTNADDADYAVQLLDPAGLESWEQAVVDALFGAGAEPGVTRDLQRSGDSELAAALRPIVAALPGAITASGFEGPAVRPRGAGGLMLAVVATAIASLVGAVFTGFMGLVIGAFGFIFVVIGIGVAAFAARKRPTLSPHGAQTVDYLLGMQMYLTLAEKDRFAVLQSATGAERIDVGDGRQLVKLYEKLLPWAVIWGVEESWARELEIQLQQTGEELDWYSGTTPFHAYQFATLLTGMRSGTNPPVTTSGSSWSGSGGSSFSSGSFGGGFSGGGGGGGGGGGR